MRTTGTGKRCVTVVLACTASGKTLPLMIIFKGKIILFKLFTGTTITLVHLTGKTPIKSDQGTVRSTRLCPSISEEWVDGCCCDATMG